MSEVSLVLLWVSALLALFLGFVVLIQGARTQLTLRFFLFILSCSAWIISNALFIMVTDKNRLMVGLLSYGAAAFLALYFYLFCRALTDSNPSSRVEKGMILLGALTAVISMIPGVVGKWVTADLAIVTNQVSLLVYAAVLLGLFGAGLAVLVRNLAKGRSIRQRKRITALIIGLIIGLAFGVGCNLVLPLLGNYGFVQLGPVGSLALVIASTYAIVRHQLFDIRMVAVRGVAYVLSLVTLACAYYLLAYVISTLFIRQGGESNLMLSPVSIVLALILAFLFQPVKALFDRITARIFFRNAYSTEDFYARLNRALAGTNDLRLLLQRAATEIRDTFKADQVFFVITYHDTHRILVGTKHHARLPVGDVARFNEHVAKHGDGILTADLLPERSTKRLLLTSHRISLLMPLVRDDAILGYVALGEHQGKGYTRRDIKILGTVADELIIAIQNALSIQEIKDINASLEQRVDMATAELRTSNARLRRVDAAKDEFLSMASHQLRTPLTSIKGYLSMVLEGDIGTVTKAQRQVLEEAFMSSERMVHLIHDFLNVSRLQTGKFMLEKSTYDLAKLVKEEVDTLKGVAESRGIEIIYDAPSGVVSMTFDETKLRQVLINYIDNAIYYSPEGSKVAVKLKKLAGRAELTVTDAGIGVPKSEQVQLFAKFYRATNARKHRPDGTGVGLYLAKKVIMAHGGNVIFSSKEGKGSTFGFWLPLEDGADQLKDKPAKD